jgi:hypothetical protein
MNPSVTKRALLACALTLAVGLGAGVGLVAAKGDHETSSLIYFTAPNTLNGNVTSPEPKCIPNRKAEVRKSRKGPDRKLGFDKTASNGWYTVVAPNTITSPSPRASTTPRSPSGIPTRAPASRCAPTRPRSPLPDGGTT